MQASEEKVKRDASRRSAQSLRASFFQQGGDAAASSARGSSVVEAQRSSDGARCTRGGNDARVLIDFREYHIASPRIPWCISAMRPLRDIYFYSIL